MKLKIVLLMLFLGICLSVAFLSPTINRTSDDITIVSDVLSVASNEVVDNTDNTYSIYSNDTLNQDMFEDDNGCLLDNSTFIISKKYTLTNDICLPDNSTLIFEGGCISGEYVITGCNTIIKSPLSEIFNNGVTLGGTWNISEVYPEWFGAKGDGITDDTQALDACFQFAASISKPTKLSAATYIVQPNKIVDWNIAPDEQKYILHAAFLMKSNMSIIGKDGSILKLKDNYVTPSNLNRFYLFFTNEVLKNVSFVNITFDLNGTNNRFNKDPSSFLTFQQAAIGVSSVYNGTRDAKIDNVLIDKCKFLNNAGCTCIATGSTNNHIVKKQKGKNWQISNCLFKNNGLDSDDHSSVFAYADDVLCTNNVFTADSSFPNGLYPNNPKNGSYCAYEVHGDNQIFVNNIVENYRQGLWITPHTEVQKNIVIKGNKFHNMFNSGVKVLSENKRTIRDVEISENDFDISGDLKQYGLKSNVVISFQSHIQECKNIRVINNNIRFLSIKPTTTNVGISISSNYHNLLIDSNIFEGCSSCVYTALDGEVGTLKITNNTFKNLFKTTDALARFSSKAIVFVNNSGKVDDLLISGNIYKNDSGEIETGILLRGSFNKVRIHDDIPENVSNYYVNDKAKINKLERN